MLILVVGEREKKVLYNFGLARTDFLQQWSKVWWLNIHVRIVVQFPLVSVQRLGGYWSCLPVVKFYAPSEGG